MTSGGVMGRLDGRVVVVTGGGRGIGRSLALAAAREGARVAITSRTQRELDAVVAEMRALGSDGLAVTADAMSRGETKAAFARVLAHYGRIDGLVNNAGGGIGWKRAPDEDPDEHEDELFEANLKLNLTSAHYATRFALPAMRAQQWGRVITIGSGYAKRSGGALAYTAAKHGLVGYTRALAAQVAGEGITVNCLCPGWTNTSLVDWNALARAHGTDAAGAKRIAENENLQRRVLEPDELGPMCTLLLSEEARGVTGQVISVDGGYKV
jgi:NAD(P)-dependent dehydrogenase (short-subunit alcohol dehydrogenase family)